MKNIIEELNILNPAMFKKLSWIRYHSSTPFYNELESNWTSQFIDALNSLSQIQVMGTGQENPDEFHINIAFMVPEAHLTFIQNFYIEGRVKELFKNNMRHSTQNDIAFHMSSVLPHSWKTDLAGKNLKSHILYEICPPGIKMHASTKEHRLSFDFFQWMLFLENTCSISAYYDFKHNARHLQTLYLNYDESTHQRIIDESVKYPSYFKNRYEYNTKNGIIHIQGMSDYKEDILFHHVRENEFISHLPYNNESFRLDIF